MENGIHPQTRDAPNEHPQDNKADMANSSHPHVESRPKDTGRDDDSNNSNNDHLIASPDPSHPANLIPALCRNFYAQGWVTGTGGGASILDRTTNPNLIYIAPSGVQKELLQPANMFVLQYPTPTYPPSARQYIRKPRGLKPSACTPLFLAAFDVGAGCCIHTHSQWAVLVTLLVERGHPSCQTPTSTTTAPENSSELPCFEISHIEQIKGIPRYRSQNPSNPSQSQPSLPNLPSQSSSQALPSHLHYHDILRVPIIPNTPFEEDLTSSLTAAMHAYPDTHAVLVQRHGIYVWGDDVAKAKTICESLDYLFRLAVEMAGLGIPWIRE